MWVQELFINFCLLIDKMIYSINTLLFELFVAVSQARFSDQIFDNFLKNIYIVIGIFMIFRVAFSLIQMLANPDMMTDKEKGVGKLTTRIVIVFAIIIMIPTIFSFAFDLQRTIIEENIIGQLILGKTDNNNQQGIKDQGKKISIDVFKGMITINGNPSNNDKINACNNALMDDSIYSIGQMEKLSVGNGGYVNCFTDTVNGEFIYNYKILVSSLATGMIAWLMVGFCIDIGVRLVKLTFLQLIAPVCAITYVSGGKDNSFNKWLKMTISSFVSVFIKLIVIYFVIFMAGQITENISSLGLKDVPLGMVAVILGLLVFAKNAPKLIGDLFGVKMDEESGFKGIAKTALLGGAALAASGGVAGLSNLGKGIGDTVKNVKDAGGLGGKAGWKALGAGALGAGLSTIAGTTSGAFHGAKNGFGKNASLGGSINKALMTSRTNRDDRDDRTKIYGGGVKGAWNNLVTDRFRGFVGMDTNAKRVVNQHKNTGQVLDRKRMNASYDQQTLASTLSNTERKFADRFVFDAFSGDEGVWKEFNDAGELVGTWDYKKESAAFDAYLTSTATATSGVVNVSEIERYVSDTRDIAQLDKQIIENNKAQGKAETQQKKMEGSNGNN